MNESLIVEMWDLLKEYGDKKHLSIVAEKYVDLLSDHGATDQNLSEALGHDDLLDEAIKTMLDIEDSEDDEDDYDYDEE
jgi:hypothetical protein